jgi:hypothetical protein
MKGFEFPFEGFVKGLRTFSNTPKNFKTLVECFNLAPSEIGLEAHEEISDITSEIDWGGLGVYTPSSITRDITIRITDYLYDTELDVVTVYIDGANKGTTNTDGELAITGLTVGGHTLRLTRADFIDSEDDTLFNDFLYII